MGGYFNRRINTSFGNSIAKRFQVIIGSVLNGIFPAVMDEIGALFSLFMGMAAYFHKRFDHPFKGIHFVIPQDEVTGIFCKRKQVGILLVICLCIFFNR